MAAYLFYNGCIIRTLYIYARFFIILHNKSHTYLIFIFKKVVYFINNVLYKLLIFLCAFKATIGKSLQVNNLKARKLNTTVLIFFSKFFFLLFTLSAAYNCQAGKKRYKAFHCGFHIMLFIFQFSF